MKHVSEVRVRYAETDQMGVVYHANYLIWCEIGRTDFIRALGFPYSEMEKSGTILAVADVNVRFIRSAVYDNLIKVFTRVTSVRSRAVKFEYDIMLDSGELLATASTVLVSVGKDGKSIGLSPEIRKSLEAAIEG